jgi:hypothetical protein
MFRYVFERPAPAPKGDGPSLLAAENGLQDEQFGTLDAALGRAQSDLISGRALPSSIEQDGQTVLSLADIRATMEGRLGVELVSSYVQAAQSPKPLPSFTSRDRPITLEEPPSEPE